MESEDLVQEERARKAAVRKSRMESELDAENADLQEKKGVSELIISVYTNISRERYMCDCELYYCNPCSWGPARHWIWRI